MPFHLKAKVFEETNPENAAHKAEIEEYWVAPDKWRRTVKAPGFTSTLIVNGSQTSEKITGDYYPHWLRTLVTAVFDPSAPIDKLDLTGPSDDPEPMGPGFCRRFESTVGIRPVTNRVYSWVCLDRETKQFLREVRIPGYHAEYSDYRPFGGRMVAWKVREWLGRDAYLKATITELTKLSTVDIGDLGKPSPIDESLFAVKEQSTPLRNVTMSETDLRKLADGNIEIRWPTIREGETEGVLSVYVWIDCGGRVRETDDLRSDDDKMAEAARLQLAKSHFKASHFGNTPVQTDGILTFGYKTKIQNPYPELTDEQARKLAIQITRPILPPGVPKGTIVTMSVIVGEDGELIRCGPFGGLPERFGSWFPGCGYSFHPLIKNGKPTPFKTVLKFVVK